MGRRVRIEDEDGIYHIFSRGNNREDIFKNDEAKGFFLKILSEYQDQLQFNIFAYVIMSNHYHILLQRRNIPVQKIMHHINNKFSKRFNFKTAHSGHVFEKRYGSISVEDENYLFWLLRYIHRNPVKAKICDYASEYIWSSDNDYRTNSSTFVNIDFILNMFSENRVNSNKIYRKLIDDKPIEEKYDDAYYPNLNILSGEINTDQAEMSLDDILLKSGVTDEEFKLIKSGSRYRNLMNYKKEYANLAIKHGFSLSEIASNINVTRQAIIKIIK